MKNRILILVAFAFLTIGVKAQQQVSYTQYMFNGMAINPGYIGTQGGLSATALSRWQWVGFEGAPTTQTFAIHTPIKGKNIGIGAQFIHDDIAVTSNTSFMLGYSYKVGIGNGFLNMGLQGGFQNLKTDLSSVYTLSNDKTFQQNDSQIKPNFGTGLFYYNPVFYAGLSVPYIINNQLKYEDENIYTQQRHFFFTSGAVFTLSPALKMKPNVLVKMVDGAPLSVDYNVNFLIHEILWLGLSVRPPESINFLIEINLNQKLRVGYAYDYIINQTLSKQANSSHEVMINYMIPWFKSNVVTPRYF